MKKNEENIRVIKEWLDIAEENLRVAKSDAEEAIEAAEKIEKFTIERIDFEEEKEQ